MKGNLNPIPDSRIRFGIPLENNAIIYLGCSPTLSIWHDSSCICWLVVFFIIGFKTGIFFLSFFLFFFFFFDGVKKDLVILRVDEW